MTTLFTAMTSNGRTANGAVTHTHTDNYCLDLFFNIGASRGKDLTRAFNLAKAENEELATKILLWSRDVRQGAGERQIFKDLVKNIATKSNIKSLINKIIELGRFDDLFVFLDTEFENDIVTTYVQAIVEGNALAAKWLPRKGKMFNLVRKALEVDPKTLRKKVVHLSNTVEQKMCAKEWDDIEFDKVPSLASSRYMTAFHRNAADKYEQYKQALVKGETKINAGAVYPYDIIKAVYNGDKIVAQEQWEALPDYLEGFEGRLLPIMDVSGSMAAMAGGNANLRCVDVAVSLGLYIAERITGTFKNTFVTFSEKPQIHSLPDKMTLENKANTIFSSNWGYNTDLQKTFNVILDSAVRSKVPASEMPTHIIILSDMGFDQGVRGQTNHDSIVDKYQRAGYELPQIIYWNLRAGASNFPVRRHQTGACLVSGFSPSLLKSVLGGHCDPFTMMLEVVDKGRYTLS